MNPRNSEFSRGNFRIWGSPNFDRPGEYYIWGVYWDIFSINIVDGQILNFPGEISEYGRQFFLIFFKNPISKLGAKLSSTLIMKISWKNIENLGGVAF